MPTEVQFPPRPFFYTLDQIGELLVVSMPTVKNWTYFEGRSIGKAKPYKMRAINIAEVGERPVWRISEQEFKRWLKNRGIRIIERGWVNFTPPESLEKPEDPA